jgi:hypothetical protein
MGFCLSLLAFVAGILGGRRSLGTGCDVVHAFGYFFGLLRARFYDTFSYFIFDAAVLGLYVAWWTRPGGIRIGRQNLGMYRWVRALMGWPIFLFGFSLLFPQHPLIQLIGLRTAVWFLPFLLIGASLRETDVSVVARALAVLNLVALGFGLGEYFLGLELFYPHNAITELIFHSQVAGYTAYRIPATFSTAANYGGAMVASVPFLAGFWGSSTASFSDKVLVLAGLFGAALGTFLCASRSPVVLLLLLAVLIAFHLRSRLGYLVLAVGVAGVVAYIVSGEERMQRFATLRDPNMVMERISVSANLGMVDILLEYPLGAGLGSAFGTNIPPILAHLRHEQFGAENEYVRIGLEQGLAGLALWIAFVIWLLIRGRRLASPGGALGPTLMYAFVFLSWATAFLGTGSLAAIPFSIMLLMQMGILGRAPQEPAPGRTVRQRHRGEIPVPAVAGSGAKQLRTL